MRFRDVAFTAAILCASAASAAAQDRVRVAVNAGQQATSTSFTQTLTFNQYLEQGSLSFERTIRKRLFYDGSVAVRVINGLHLGGSVSFFQDQGTGTVAAQVPHPFFFNQLRATSGDVPAATRRETATHIQAAWTVPAAGGIEFTAFGGPTFFQVEQVFVTRLTLALTGETFPYDTLSFPGVATETAKERVMGYNAGVDMTWRFSQHVGAGTLIRYTHGNKSFTPAGGQAITIEVGGLHAGGGLRLVF